MKTSGLKTNLMLFKNGAILPIANNNMATLISGYYQEGTERYVVDENTTILDIQEWMDKGFKDKKFHKVK